MTWKSMQQGLTVALVLLAVVAIAACAPTDITLTADDDGTDVTIANGGTLTVTLEGNPTTGYTWAAYDPPAFLEPEGEPAFEPDSEALGAGGMMTLEFKAVEAGSGTLELWYSRPWESVQPEQTFTVNVTVK